MDLSIIIVSYNTKELLRQCLNSLVLSSPLRGIPSEYKKQVLRVEIVVVDNGSKDGSVEMVKEMRGSIIDIKSTTGIIVIKLIENKENLGFAKAVNQGLRQAQGRVVLLVNSDTQVKEETLGKLLDFEEEVRPAIIGLRMLNPDGSIQGSVFNFPTMRRAILEYWLGKKGAFSKYAPEDDKPVGVEAVSGGAMVISREILEKVGLLVERYFMYFEDLDFCRRAKKAGFKIYYLPSAEITHEHGASGVNLARTGEQWKRLVPSSKVYHGVLKHFLISFILWSGQKCLKRKKQ